MKSEDIKSTRDAVARLSGCPASHLSLPEAKLIQAVREVNLTDADILLLTDTLTKMPLQRPNNH